MLRRQVWMADYDEFDYIVKNSQRVLDLNIQFKNHPHAEEFTKQCNVMFIYETHALKGEAHSTFSLVIYGIIFRNQTTQPIFAGK